jgi:hypothetical protein
LTKNMRLCLTRAAGMREENTHGVEYWENFLGSMRGAGFSLKSGVSLAAVRWSHLSYIVHSVEF